VARRFDAVPDTHYRRREVIPMKIKKVEVTKPTGWSWGG
jgi:hypothetical protein